MGAEGMTSQLRPMCASVISAEAPCQAARKLPETAEIGILTEDDGALQLLASEDVVIASGFIASELAYSVAG